MTPDEARARYEAGATVRELAEDAGIGRTQMRTILVKAGTKLRGAGKKVGRHGDLGREILGDLPSIEGPVTLATLHEWLGGNPKEIERVVARMFRDGDVAIVPGARS